MKIGFSGSPFLANKLVAIYAVAMTGVAGVVLLLPAQGPAPNVVYDLFKIGQTSADPAQLATGWKPVGYACQTANPEQIAQGFGPTVCGYNYRTATHNLITAGGIDWLMCSMSRSKTSCSTLAQYIALSTDGAAPAVTNCLSGSATCTLTSEIVAAGDAGLVRAAGTFGFLASAGACDQSGIANDTSSAATYCYTLSKTFTAAATDTGIIKSAIFTKPGPPTAGTMVFVNTFSSTNMISGDTLAVTWTITV